MYTNGIKFLLLLGFLGHLTRNSLRSCNPGENGGKNTKYASKEAGNPVTHFPQPRHQLHDGREIFFGLTKESTHQWADNTTNKSPPIQHCKLHTARDLQLNWSGPFQRPLCGHYTLLQCMSLQHRLLNSWDPNKYGKWQPRCKWELDRTIDKRRQCLFVISFDSIRYTRETDDNCGLSSISIWKPSPDEVSKNTS